MLRISLILTIAVALGAIAISEFVVRPHVRSIIASRDKNRQDFQREQSAHRDTKASLEMASADLEKKEKLLSDTKAQFAGANAKATEQERRATALQSELAKATQELGAAKADLAAWAGLPPVDQIKPLFAEAKRLRVENEALRQERDVLIAQWKKRSVPGFPDDNPTLPAGLKGTVVAVDPKFDFVVLDIGALQGVEPRGVLLISREGRLVGKVKVASVKTDTSVANIVPGWKLGELREGDLALY
jgi:hypothetical protein